MLLPRLQPGVQAGQAPAARPGALQVCRTPDNLGSTLSRPALYCASDASSKGFAAYVLDTDFTFQQPFNTQEVKRQAQGKYDSNLREARAVRLGLEAILGRQSLRGAFVAWASDCFGMVGHLRSLSLGRLRRIRSPELEAECKSICRLAAEHDLTVAWLWCKREEPIMQVADYLSRRSPDMQLEERLYLQRLTSMTQAAPCEPVQLFAPQLDCFVHI